MRRPSATVSQTRRLLPGPEAAKGHVAMLMFSALVAGSFSLGSIAAPMIHPLALNILRFALAAGIVGGLALATGRLKRRYFVAPWRFVILGGLFAVYFGMMFWALQTAPPVSMSAVFTLTPIMAAGFGWLLMRQVTTPRMALALGVAAAGALWVIFDGSLAAMARFDIGFGELVFLTGCIAHSAYAPAVPRLSRGEPILALTFGMLVAACGIFLLVGTPAFLATEFSSLPSIVWITIFYVAVFASAATFFLLQYAALRLPGAKVMAYTYLTPSWVILWEAGLGNGWPDPVIWPGVGLVILGLVLLLKD